MVRVEGECFDPGQIGASGQCFRMNRLADGGWRVVARGAVLTLGKGADGCVYFDCGEAAFEGGWRDYFDLTTDYGAFVRAAESGGDYLARAAAFGRGIRILRQEPFETLISFIISQRKNIPAIKRAVESLCALCGEPIGETGFFAFPRPEKLASLNERGIAPCALGYRAKYVLGAARKVAEGEIDLDALRSAPDEALKAALMALSGVGEKVAHCTMLFGFHRLDAFPVDVWIRRVLDEEYPAGFPAERFGGFGGVAQQYLFAYARARAGKGEAL